jgi:branched-chain amino acid transport system permease protein
MFGIPFSVLGLQIFMGFALGMIFVLLAVGLSLIFGMLTVVNFAHGAFYMWGAYAGLLAMGYIGNFWVSLVLVPILIGMVGLILERTAVRRLYGMNPDYPLLLTFGFSLIMIEIVRLIWGTADHPFNSPPILQGPVNLGLFFFPSYWLFVIVVTFVILILLWILLKKTDIGLIIRAGTRDSLMVRVFGIDISKVWLLVFGIGTGMAGLAGILAAPMRGVYPEMGITMIIECFVVVVVGGMGSLKGAIYSGILLGLVASLTTLVYPAMSKIVIFLVMAVVLLIRPSGLFGEKGLME